MYAIAGATGRVGSVTAQILLNAGVDVRVLVRRKSDAEAWETQGAETRITSLEDQAVLSDALDDVAGFFVLLPFDLSADNLGAHADALIASITGAVAAQQVPHVVDCGQPHQLETVSVIDLGKKFPDAYPDGKEMDKFLSDTCTAAAEDYLGGEEQLYQSTLQPFWGTVSEESWNGGTKSVNCFLVHARAGGGFSAITGSATGGRQALTIDGKPPEERPERNPLREDKDNKPAPESAAPAPAPAP